jgi:hypothetical protein
MFNGHQGDEANSMTGPADLVASIDRLAPSA